MILVSTPGATYAFDTVRLLEFIMVVAIQSDHLEKLTEALVGYFQTVLAHTAENQTGLSPALDETIKVVHPLMKTAIQTFGQAKSHVPLMLELTYCRVVDNYLAYVSGLLAAIYQAKPEALKSNDHVTMEFILQHTNLEELLGAITEKKVLEISFKGLMDLDKYISKHLGFPLIDNENDLKRAAVIIERRNLFTHNRGIINRRYLERVPDCSQKVGEKLILDSITTGQDLAFLGQAVVATDRRACQKFGLEVGERLDQTTLEGLLRSLAMAQQHLISPPASVAPA